MMSSHVAILGPGLLGGSLALALRERSLARVSVWARRQTAIEEARARNCCDEASTDPASVVSRADVVVFATPIGAMPQLAREIAPHLKPGALVTDVGSVKLGICGELGVILSETAADFVGSHPMAGSEQTGLASARPDLFDASVCIVTPDERTKQSVVQRTAEFWRAVGCRVRVLPPAEHDAIVASVSHLPHLLAAALVNSIAASTPAAFDFCGPGFRDTTRVASGPPAMWTEILAENRDAVRLSLDALIEKLRALSTLLSANSPERDSVMHQFLTEAKAQRDRLWQPKISSDV
jgi:prephenate dehydrogenase